ncbi:MAG: NTPase [Nitrososphaerota archaeon]
MKGPLFALTGPPGSGKTTLALRLVQDIRAQGHAAGGVISLEVREGGRRTGFVMRDLLTGEQELLATTKGGRGPRLGRYFVNVEGIGGFCRRALERARQQGGLVVVDEVGPMELLSEEFVGAVEEALGWGRPLLVVLHQRSAHALASRIRASARALYSLAERPPELVRRELLEALLAELRAAKPYY